MNSIDTYMYKTIGYKNIIKRGIFRVKKMLKIGAFLAINLVFMKIAFYKNLIISNYVVKSDKKCEFILLLKSSTTFQISLFFFYKEHLNRLALYFFCYYEIDIYRLSHYLFLMKKESK